MSNKRCGTCVFWRFGCSTDDFDQKLHPDNYIGDCRRYPPMLPGGTEESEFPLVEAGEWCGEYKDAL